MSRRRCSSRRSTAATALAAAMDYIGVLCVEFFICCDRTAPWWPTRWRRARTTRATTAIDACDVSQFELQVRCLAGLPLVAPRLHSPAVMLNLLGDLWFDADGDPGRERAPRWAEVLALPGTHLHLYGKASARRGRKMGHLTVTATDAAQARAVALQAAALLGLPTF